MSILVFNLNSLSADWSEIPKRTQNITANFTVEAHTNYSEYTVSERYISPVCFRELPRLTASTAFFEY